MSNRALRPASTADLGTSFKYNASAYLQTGKRPLDVFLSVMLLPILLPIIAVLGIALRFSGGPAFFGHTRVGKDGRTFKCWKLRTMVMDAEERLQELLERDPAARTEWERDRKLRDDPRVTPLGSFLRRTSLDELPQIFNVLKGDMSLVGPRPVTTDELERYGSHKQAYLAMRPGVTGLWQVSGRNDVSYPERVAMDNNYYHAVSLTTDMRILVKTTSVVLRRTGI
ncbi:MAG: sugar transferase [Pseudomonadota bacterium]